MSVLVVLLLTMTACEDLTGASPTASAGTETTVPPSEPTTTLEFTVDLTADGTETTTGAETATTAPTTDSSVAGPDSTTTEDAPDVVLGKDDFSREVRLEVGDRVRMELPAKVSEKVVSVEWRYEPIIVEEQDSGTSEVSGFVTDCWLELEALAEGQVTIRTIYERSDGTTRAVWVVYLFIGE
jgi:hypothetical protein